MAEVGWIFFEGGPLSDCRRERAMVGKGAPLPLRALIVGDVDSAVAPILEALADSGYAPEIARVTSESELAARLAENWDLVLADIGRGQFGALVALRVIKARNLDLPLIVVLDQAQEQMARECLIQGAVHCVTRNHLACLGPMVTQTVRAKRDRTEKQAALAALRRSNDLLEATLEATPIAIVGLDLDGRVREIWNPAAERLLGWTRDEALGRFLPSVPEEAEEEFEEFRTWVRTGQPLLGVEVRRQRKDGTPIEYSIYAAPLHDAQGEIIGNIAVLMDITARKEAEAERARLEDHLRQARKMETLGRLAGGVAHDFNNLLTAIKGNLSVALADLTPSHPTYECLSEVDKAANRAAGLIQQLLAFSRKQVIEPVVTDLNELICEFRNMLDRVIGENIKLQTLLPANLGRVKVDRNQIEQVLLNLAVNGRDAMLGGGTLTLETRNVVLDLDSANAYGDIPPGEYVSLSVSDTGSGITEEVQRHLFEPFFTTKTPGEGTGLGLAMAYGAVQQNNGKMEVISKLGVGTTFRILLPRVFDPLEPVSPPLALDSLDGREMILLVEDDAAIRALAKRALEKRGYRVVSCEDGSEALRIAEQRALAVDVLVTDVILPGINGRVLAESMLRAYPQLTVIYTSGYPADVIGRHGVLAPSTHFVAKPYTADTLARKIREALALKSTTAAKD